MHTPICYSHGAAHCPTPIRCRYVSLISRIAWALIHHGLRVAQTPGYGRPGRQL